MMTFNKEEYIPARSATEMAGRVSPARASPNKLGTTPASMRPKGSFMNPTASK